MQEVEYEFLFNDDHPGDIVEALNNDKEYLMWETDPLTGEGIAILIQPDRIKIKILQNE